VAVIKALLFFVLASLADVTHSLRNDNYNFNKHVNQNKIMAGGRAAGICRGPLRALRNQPMASSSSEIVPSGLLALYKPPGFTSNDALGKLKRVLYQVIREQTGEKPKLKVGHGGTLDPLAEGVLVVGIGKGTKQLQEYLSGPKSYRALALLGSETDTLDNTGTVTETAESSHVTREMLGQSLSQFRGDIQQVPPMYSALKKDGKKLYELARKGIEIERPPRAVTVYKLDLLSEWKETGESIKLPAFGLDISCGGGFYVRSCISDIGKACESRAHMTSLVRTKQGPFDLDDCLHLDDWNFDAICAHIIKCSSKLGTKDQLQSAAKEAADRYMESLAGDSKPNEEVSSS
jgi:tRNA pseudouridine55 synthase